MKLAFINLVQDINILFKAVLEAAFNLSCIQFLTMYISTLCFIFKKNLVANNVDINTIHKYIWCFD